MALEGGCLSLGTWSCQWPQFLGVQSGCQRPKFTPTVLCLYVLKVSWDPPECPSTMDSLITELLVERVGFVLSLQNGLPTQHWGPPNWQWGPHASTYWVSPWHWVTPQQWVSPLALNITPLAPRAGSGTVLGAAGCYGEWCGGDTRNYWGDSRGLVDSASAEDCGDTGKVLIKEELGGLGTHPGEWVVSRVSPWHRGAH